MNWGNCTKACVSIGQKVPKVNNTGISLNQLENLENEKHMKTGRSQSKENFQDDNTYQ